MAETVDGEKESLSPSFKLDIEDYECPICRDLQFKPVTNACGHVFCFWCIYKAMSFLTESSCPMCRQPFSHFASICGLLHGFLAESFPEEYAQRAVETRAMEDEQGNYAPDIDSSGARTPTLTPEDKEGSNVVKEVEAKSTRKASPKADWTTADFKCQVCKDLLYQPTVLNCGHVFCLACVGQPPSEVLPCPVCPIQHRAGPSGLSVCGELDLFLQHAFPHTSARRKQQEDQRSNQAPAKENAAPSQPVPSSRSSPPTIQEAYEKAKEIVTDARQELLEQGAGEDLHFITSRLVERWGDHTVHFGVGCDGCGVCPIVGKRFRCQDCPEQMGFDLCSQCQALDPPPQGRFNQRHTSSHRMQEAFDSRLTYHSILAANPELRLATVLQWVAEAEEDSEDDEDMSDAYVEDEEEDESNVSGSSEWEETTWEDLDEDTRARLSIGDAEPRVENEAEPRELHSITDARSNERLSSEGSAGVDGAPTTASVEDRGQSAGPEGCRSAR